MNSLTPVNKPSPVLNSTDCCTFLCRPLNFSGSSTLSCSTRARRDALLFCIHAK